MNAILDPVFKIVVLALLVWTLKGYIMEKTLKRRATDQAVTLGELQAFCKEKHGQFKEESSVEIGHVAQLIEKELEHGRARFISIETKIQSVETKMDGHHTALTEINLVLKGIHKELEKSNSNGTGKGHHDT